MAVIIVTLPAGSPATLKNGVNQLVVVAADAAAAKVAAAAYAATQGYDGAKQAFAAADTQIVGAGAGIWASGTEGAVFAAAQ